MTLPSERKISSYYEKGEAPVEFASTVEEYYRQNIFSAEVLLWHSSDNGKTAFKNVVWRRFWSGTLAISLLFSNDLDKFKLETQIKAFKNIVDEKQVGIKEAIKFFSSLNASQKLLVSEVLKLVKPILLAPTTNVVSERSRSTLCRVCIYCWLVFNLDFVLNYVASNDLEIALFWKILPPQCERACGGPAHFVKLFISFIVPNSHLFLFAFI